MKRAALETEQPVLFLTGRVLHLFLIVRTGREETETYICSIKSLV
jgi:hypothetical protein